MNIRKFLLFFLCCCCVGYAVQAQYYNQRSEFLKVNGQWVFSGYSGMNFNANPPQAFTAALSGTMGSASVASPKTGDLLFYTDGRNVYNKNNVKMPNGSLKNTAKITSPYEGVCIIPMIDSPGKYYVFVVEEPSYPNQGVLTYSIVDTSLNGGLGDVVAGRKDIYLDSQLNNTVIAVPGDNCDIWLIAHRRDTSLFKNYHITRNGLSTTPVISNVGPMKGRPPVNAKVAATVTWAYAHSYLSVSSDRKKISILSRGLYNLLGLSGSRPYFPNIHGVLVCDFNPATGVVSNGLRIDSSIHNSYIATCFSPDASKLYLTVEPDTGDYTAYVYQFDLSSNDSSIIANSITPIARTYNSGSPLKLYNDTIYSVATSANTMFARINKPNLAGTACDFQDDVAALTVGGIGYCLPNEVPVVIPPDTVHAHAFDTIICQAFSLDFKGRPGFSGYEWNTGATDTGITVTQQGTYWVTSKDYCHSYTDTFVIDGVNMPQLLITVNGFTLGTSSTYTTYQWYFNGTLLTNETNPTYTVTQNGTYSVKVSNTYGCSDSVSYEVTNVGVPSITQLQNVVRTYPNPAKDVLHIMSPVPVTVTINTIEGRQVTSKVNATQINISDLAEGIYMLRITDTNGQFIKTEKIVKIK